MARILTGILIFCILAYTIGYFVVHFKKPLKENGSPKTPFEVGSQILVIMLGMGLLLFALFALYTFGTYLFSKK